jgi:geranylgeranyl pyrophosphate synthase
LSDGALHAVRTGVDAAVLRFCDRYLENDFGQLSDVVRYSATGGGKRFRGVLLCAVYEAAGGASFRDALDLAAAVEVIHAYSLVHDDLPCMDDDDMRRGRPSAHRRFGVEAAVAAGILMVPLAVRAAAEAARALGHTSRDAALIAGELVVAAGGGGMIAGQLLDLEGEGKSLAQEDLRRVHAAKTGALIAASARAGAMAAHASSQVQETMGSFGERIGLAFQITDDLLDVTTSSHALGKTAGKDAVVRKSTYPALLGVDGAATLARQQAESGAETLRGAALLTETLAALSAYVATRSS